MSIQSLGRLLPTARTSAKPRPGPRGHPNTKVQGVTCAHRWCCLTPFTATCSYPGCKYPGVVYPADHFWNYCGELHEQYIPFIGLLDGNSPNGLCSYARKGCVSCRQADENGTQLCAACDTTFKQKAPTIIPIPMDHDAFWRGTVHIYFLHWPELIPIHDSVSDQFTESWAHPTQCPVVQAVFKIALTQDSLETHIWYRFVFHDLQDPQNA